MKRFVFLLLALVSFALVSEAQGRFAAFSYAPPRNFGPPIRWSGGKIPPTLPPFYVRNLLPVSVPSPGSPGGFRRVFIPPAVLELSGGGPGGRSRWADPHKPFTVPEWRLPEADPVCTRFCQCDRPAPDDAVGEY